MKFGPVIEKLFFEDIFEDIENNRLEAKGSELPWVCCAGYFATGLYIARFFFFFRAAFKFGRHVFLRSGAKT